MFNNFIHNQKFKDISIFFFTLALTSFFTFLLGSTFIVKSNVINLLSIILTGINVGVAYLTALYSKKSAKYQKDSVVESEQTNQSSQAIKIYAHIIQSLVKSGTKIKKLKGIYQPLVIGNSSNEPIYKVYVVSYSNKSNFKVLKNRYDNLQKQNDKDRGPWIHYYIYLRIVMPGTIFRIIKTQGGAMGGTRPAATIFFTDSKGNKWVRDAQGNLQILTNSFDVCKFCHINKTDINAPVIVDNYNYKTLADFYKKHPKKTGDESN